MPYRKLLPPAIAVGLFLGILNSTSETALRAQRPGGVVGPPISNFPPPIVREIERLKDAGVVRSRSGEAPVGTTTRDGCQAILGTVTEGDALAGLRVLDAMREALGGADKLTAVMDITKVHWRAPNTKGVIHRWVRASHWREDFSGRYGRIAVYSDGNSGWSLSSSGVRPLATGAGARLFGRRVIQSLLIPLLVPGLGQTVQSTSANALRIVDWLGNPTYLVLDQATKTPSRLYFDGDQNCDNVTYLEWKDVDGLRLPTKELRSIHGREDEIAVLEWTINTGLTVEALSQAP